jgi:voltage-gated potassium channel
MLEHYKRRAYQVLEDPEHEHSIFRHVTFFIIVLVILNVAVVILETEKELSSYGRLFALFDGFSAIVFTIEYLVRLWVCTENPKYASAARGRLRYAASGMAIIDLIAILPFYLMFLPQLRVIRLVRIARILRLLKLVRYSDATNTMARVLHNKKEELLITFGLGITMIIISSTLVYYAESEAQPEKFSSIIASMWWSVVTLATCAPSAAASPTRSVK